MPRTSGQATAVTVTTTTETILATLPGLAAAIGAPIYLSWDLDFSSGAATTALTFNLRRGTLITSPLVQAFGPNATTASTRFTWSGQATDAQAGEVSNQQYVITVVQTAATGNGTGNFCYIRADWG